MLSILIPCFNEEENFKIYEEELFSELNKLKTPYEIVFVNDGSKDNTKREIEKIKKKKKNITLVSYDQNRGLGYAIRQGIIAARGDLTITLDADLTFHPKQIKKLMDRFKEGNCDCVIGSHFLAGGKLEKVPFYRKALSKCVNLIYCILMGRNIKSISSIFRLYRTEDLKALSLEATGFDINAEILFKLIKKKKRIVEIPAVLTTRKYGVSKLNTRKEMLNHIKLMCKMLRWKWTT